jgi:hypothetical protein
MQNVEAVLLDDRVNKIDPCVISAEFFETCGFAAGKK